MEILKFYREILKSLSCEVDREGYISFREPGGVLKPISIDGRRLVLPTKKRLDDGITEDLIAFHPIGENLARKGPSHVISKLQQIAKARLAQYILRITQTLVHVASTPALHKDLSPECSAFLKHTTTADGKTPKEFESLITQAISKGGLITVYLRANGSIADAKYNRMCVVRLPIMEQLANTKEDAPYGVKLRKKHRTAILGLFQYLFPEGDQVEAYSGGSNNQTAPFLEAFLEGYGKITTRLNELIELFGDQVNLELEPFDLKYLKRLPKLDEYHRAIPVLEGNEGNLAKNEEAPEEADSTPPWSSAAEQAALAGIDREPTRTVTQSQPTSAPTSRSKKPVEEESGGGGLTMDEIRRRRQAQQGVQPQPQPYGVQPQPQYGPHGQTMPGYPPQQYQVPQQQAPVGWPQQQMAPGYPQQQMGYGHPPVPQGPQWAGGGAPQQPQYQPQPQYGQHPQYQQQPQQGGWANQYSGI